jgi:hypothetical protein
MDRKNNLMILEMAHIPLWLIKDMCWLFTWRSTGVIIAIPTVLVAIIIVWVTRNEKTKFLPNLSIAFWIIANASWMVNEFYDFKFRYYSVVPFLLGLIVFFIYLYKIIKNKIVF